MKNKAKPFLCNDRSLLRVEQLKRNYFATQRIENKDDPWYEINYKTESQPLQFETKI